MVVADKPPKTFGVAAALFVDVASEFVDLGLESGW